MSMKAKPFKDEEELLPLCYRCAHRSPLLGERGNGCANCGQPFVFSFASFEPLPLVEFAVPEEIGDEEALALIDHVPNSQFEKDAAMRARQAVYGAAPQTPTSREFVFVFVCDRRFYLNIVRFRTRLLMCLSVCPSVCLSVCDIYVN